jgi:hypothetical protein
MSLIEGTWSRRACTSSSTRRICISHTFVSVVDPYPLLLADCASASAFESFQLGAGHPTTVGHWTRSFPFPTKRTGCGVLNNEGKRVWTTDGPTKGKCIWEMHSVWAWDEMKHTAVVLRENYFRKHPTTGAQVS